MAPRVTAAILTVGRSTFEACRKAVDAQTLEHDTTVIDHVSPVSAALQAMVDRCTTEFVVQVDEDIILDRDALTKLVTYIDAMSPHTVMVSMPLRDVEIDETIYGVKIYRAELVRLVPFENHQLGDLRDRERWTAAGLEWFRAPKYGNVVGKHGTHYTPEEAFDRWRRAVRRRRAGKSIVYVDDWPKRMLAQYQRDGNARDLYALLGCLVGMRDDLDDVRSDDFRREDDALKLVAKLFPLIR